MPRNLEELASMIAERDKISFNEAMESVRECAQELQYAFMTGNLDEVEDVLKYSLGLEPDYLDLFIF